MMENDSSISIGTRTPVLRRGCRLREESEPLLLIPEGILKLSPGGLRVIRLCDGSRSVSRILAELKAQHSPNYAGRIETETMAFLQRLVEKQVLSLL